MEGLRRSSQSDEIVNARLKEFGLPAYITKPIDFQEEGLERNIFHFWLVSFRWPQSNSYTRNSSTSSHLVTDTIQVVAYSL